MDYAQREWKERITDDIWVDGAEKSKFRMS